MSCGRRIRAMVSDLDVWYCHHCNSCWSGVRRVGSVVSVVITADKVLVVVVLVKDVV